MARSARLTIWATSTGKARWSAVDLNLPMADGEVTDDTRIRAAPTTIRTGRQGREGLLLAHFGSPKGERRSDHVAVDGGRIAVQEVMGGSDVRAGSCRRCRCGRTVKRAMATLRSLKTPASGRARKRTIPISPAGRWRSWRSLRQRCLFRRAPRACSTEGWRMLPARLCRSLDAGRA
jgi:hypothetical protein